jgi:predicted nucleic acid-binding protein
MTITTKIIITDTNIITDLSNANILDKFVKLDNVYISDMIKNDEVNSNTGNVSIINEFKMIDATSLQISEIFEISQKINGLSQYDIINFIIARDNNAILATGDQKLRDFSISNGVDVIRTLKIIQLMKNENIISKKEAINACTLLKENKCTRIPKEDIENIINEFEKD